MQGFMRLSDFFVAFISILSIGSATVALPGVGTGITRRAITQDLMNQFIRYAKLAYASEVFLTPCESPVGTTVVQAVDNKTTDTQGYISRDDDTKEIIVALRGSTSLQDFVTDVFILLVPYNSPGVSNPSNAKAHFGFLTAYNSVAPTILSAVSSELAAHPDYSLVVVGHSLGGALASLGGMSLAANFPDKPLKVFTFGQPRTGDQAYADLAESLIGAENLFRAVHTSDGVPTLIPESIGYRHHRTEFWNFQDPSTDINNVRQCDGQEDPTCSNSITSGGINAPHLEYFGLNILDVTFKPSLVCS